MESSLIEHTIKLAKGQKKKTTNAVRILKFINHTSDPDINLLLQTHVMKFLLTTRELVQRIV